MYLLLINSSSTIEKDSTNVFINFNFFVFDRCEFSDVVNVNINSSKAFLKATSIIFSLLKLRSYGSEISMFVILYIFAKTLVVENLIKNIKNNKNNI